MIALEVLVNGVRRVLAGVEDWQVLFANVVAMRARAENSGADGFSLRVNGVPIQTSDGVLEHLRWGEIALEVGDEVTIRIISVAASDPPLKRYRSDAEVRESPFTDAESIAMEREEFLRLKAKFDPADG